MPPKIKIYLFTPAKDQSRERVCHEIPRLTLAHQTPPLPQDLLPPPPSPKLRLGDGADREVEFAS